MVLFGDYRDPTTMLSYFSKKEDTDKIHELIGDSIDWKKVNDFFDICDWHVSGLLKLCEKHGIATQKKSPLWELQETEKKAKLQNISSFKSKSGHNLIVKKLDSFEYAQFIDDNWEFKDEFSLHWIHSQCKNGFAYGVFTTSEETKVKNNSVEQGQDERDDLDTKINKQPISWISAYKYGAMGLLKTSSEWRGEGCAKACINNLAFHMESLGIVPYVYIEDWNVGSISLFEKMGFVKTHNASWICCLPKQHQLQVDS